MYASIRMYEGMYNVQIPSSTYLWMRVFHDYLIVRNVHVRGMERKEVESGGACVRDLCEPIGMQH